MMKATPIDPLRTEAAASDGAFVRAARAGDPQALEHIMRRHNRRLFRIARSMTGGDADAEDIVQETFVRAFTNLDQLAEPDNLGGWLCRIAVNEAAGWLRERKRFVPLETPSDPEEDDEDYQAGGVDSSPAANPEGLAMTSELVQLIERAIDQLPPGFRAVFVMREVEQMSIAETAGCLDIPEATVKTRLHRARIMLQRALRPRIGAALGETFAFAGERCDRIVAAVFSRLSDFRSGQPPDKPLH